VSDYYSGLRGPALIAAQQQQANAWRTDDNHACIACHGSHDRARVLIGDDIAAGPRRRPDRRLRWPERRCLATAATVAAVAPTGARWWWWWRWRRLRLLAALALQLRRALPWPALAHPGVRRQRVRVRHKLVLCFRRRRRLRLILRRLRLWFLRLRLGLAVLAVTAFVRLGLAVLTAATFLRLGILRLGWLGWNRPDVHDDDLLHDLIPGLAPDLLAELLGVEFPAHHHHLLLLLVLELHLLDAELLFEAVQDLGDLGSAATAV